MPQPAKQYFRSIEIVAESDGKSFFRLCSIGIAHSVNGIKCASGNCVMGPSLRMGDGKVPPKCKALVPVRSPIMCSGV